MTVDLLPETMRFVSVGDDGRYELEFVFEVTCGLTRFTLPVTVGGHSSIDQALGEATEGVRAVALSLARAARGARWADRELAEKPPSRRADVGQAMGGALLWPFRVDPHRPVRALVAGDSAAGAQCCNATLEVA